MKQFRFEYHNSELLEKELSEFRNQNDSDAVKTKLFQIYSEVLEEDAVRKVCEVIGRIFPDTPYMGCSTSGNIIDCQLSGSITVVCTVFDRIVEETEKNSWVKAIELYFTIPEGSTTRFCDGLKNIRKDVQIFGGVA